MINSLQERGDFFGEMALIDILPHSANVIATCETRILAFPMKVLTIFFRMYLGSK